MAYDHICIPKLETSTPVENASYIPELNDAIREIKTCIKNDGAVLTKAVNYTLLESDSVILASDNIQLSLPAATGLAGKTYTIKKTDATHYTNCVIIVPNGAAKIDGLNANIVLKRQWQTVHLITNGTDWFRIQHSQVEQPTHVCQGKNLMVFNKALATETQMQITAEELVLFNSEGLAAIFAPTSPVYVNITIAGAGGLDTGSEAEDTWYYIWGIGKSDGTFNGLFSISNTSPTMPAGYTYKMFLGAVYNNASSDFNLTTQIDNHFHQLDYTVLVNAQTKTSYFACSLAGLPNNIRTLGLELNQANGTGAGVVVDAYIALDINGVGEQRIRHYVPNAYAWKDRVNLHVKGLSDFYYKGDADCDLTIKTNQWSW